MKFKFFAILVATNLCMLNNAHANDKTQNGQSPEFFLQALCQGDGHLGKSLGQDYADVIQESKKINGRLRPGNSTPENYKIADVTYQNLDKKDLSNCHEYTGKKLTGLIDQRLKVINKN